MTEPTIRVVTEGDAHALAKLLNELIAIGGMSALEKAFTPQSLADAMLNGTGVICCVVAEDGEGALVGFQSMALSDHLPGEALAISRPRSTLVIPAFRVAIRDCTAQGARDRCKTQCHHPGPSLATEARIVTW